MHSCLKEKRFLTPNNRNASRGRKEYPTQSELRSSSTKYGVVGKRIDF